MILAYTYLLVQVILWQKQQIIYYLLKESTNIGSAPGQVISSFTFSHLAGAIQALALSLLAFFFLGSESGACVTLK